MNRLYRILLAGLVSANAHAEPLLEKSVLFTPGQGGYGLYRIPGLIVSQRGVVLAYCEARRTGKSDWDTIDIVLRRSSDGGKSWSPPQKIADVPGPKMRNPAIIEYKQAKPDDVTYQNPVAISARDGTVHFLFGLEYMRCFYMRSDDDGATWSQPSEITSTFAAFRPAWDWRVIAVGPGHGIQLQSGRLLVPVWLSTGTGGGNAHRPSVAATIFSDDNGTNWQRGDIAIPNTDLWINPNETVAVQLADGRVLLNVRNETKANRRLITTSKDGATVWAPPHFDQALLEPICMASIVRFSQKPASAQNIIIFANPDNLSRADGRETPGMPRDRKNLSIKLTYDEGETWPVNKVLEPGVSAYSDLAVAADGTILCFYERANPELKTSLRSDQLALARFNLAWVTGRERP